MFSEGLVYTVWGKKRMTEPEDPTLNLTMKSQYDYDLFKDSVWTEQHFTADIFIIL